jgi:hypothetical protein
VKNSAPLLPLHMSDLRVAGLRHTWPTVDCEEQWRVASKAQGAGLKPGLYKGEEGFHCAQDGQWGRGLAALEMTKSKGGKRAAIGRRALYWRPNTRRFGSVRLAVWMAIVKVLPPIGAVNSPLHLNPFGEVNSPLLSTYAVLRHY